MAAIIPAQPTISPAPLASPAVYRTQQYHFTVHQYDKMTAAGIIAEDEPVELIEGFLVTKMGRNRPHIVAGKKGLRVLTTILPPGWHVAKEDPIVASDWSKPEPDLAIIKGSAEDYLDQDVSAGDVALVIEIAESSLSIDQRDMARVYASSGIPVYWIVNLVDNQIEVYAKPGPNGYQSSVIFKPGQEVAVTIDGVEAGRIAVADILP
jgi:Uma2 family endonuclease